MNKPSLTLVRRMKASPDTIYGAWTDAAQIMKWFGPAEAQMNVNDTKGYKMRKTTFRKAACTR